MNITCKTTELAKVVATVERAAASRDNMPALMGILLDATGTTLECACTDLSIGIRQSIEVEVAAEGKVLLDAKLFGAIVRKLPGETTALESEPDKNQLVIRSGRSEFRLQTMDAEEFPALPALDSDGYHVGLVDLHQLIKQTEFATVPDQSRPFLSGVLMEFAPGKLNMAATDNARLCFCSVAIDDTLVREDGDDNSIQYVVPADALREVARLCSGRFSDPVFNGAKAAILADKNRIVFHLGDVTVSSALIEGKYPDYRRVLGGVPTTTVTIDRKAFLGAMERASLVAHKGPSFVTLAMSEKGVTLTASEADSGEVREDLESEHEGPELTACYNPRFVVDFCRATYTSKVVLGLTDPAKQATLRPVGDESYTYVLMPVQK